MAQEFGSQPPLEAPTKKNNTTTIIIIVLVVLLLLCLCCVAGGWFLFSYLNIFDSVQIY